VNGDAPGDRCTLHLASSFRSILFNRRLLDTTVNLLEAQPPPHKPLSGSIIHVISHPVPVRSPSKPTGLPRVTNPRIDCQTCRQLQPYRIQHAPDLSQTSRTSRGEIRYARNDVSLGDRPGDLLMVACVPVMALDRRSPR
jgi:hypothetical protein